MFLLQRGEQQIVQPAESAVGHDQRVITRTQVRRQIGRELTDVARRTAARTEFGDDRLGIPTEIAGRVQPDVVGRSQRGSERVAMHAESHRIRARLEHRDDARRTHVGQELSPVTPEQPQAKGQGWTLPVGAVALGTMVVIASE